MNILASIKTWLLAALAVVAAVLFGLLQRSGKKQAQDKADQAQADAKLSQSLTQELTKGEAKAHAAEHDPITDDQFTKS